MTPSRWLVLVIWWITCVIWSSVFLFIKVGVTEVPPLGFATSRLALAALALLLFATIKGYQWPKTQRDWVVI